MAECWGDTNIVLHFFRNEMARNDELNKTKIFPVQHMMAVHQDLSLFAARAVSVHWKKKTKSNFQWITIEFWNECSMDPVFIDSNAFAHCYAADAQKKSNMLFVFAYSWPVGSVCTAAAHSPGDNKHFLFRCCCHCLLMWWINSLTSGNEWAELARNSSGPMWRIDAVDAALLMLLRHVVDVGTNKINDTIQIGFSFLSLFVMFVFRIWHRRKPNCTESWIF